MLSATNKNSQPIVFPGSGSKKQSGGTTFSMLNNYFMKNNSGQKVSTSVAKREQPPFLSKK